MRMLPPTTSSSSGLVSSEYQVRVREPAPRGVPSDVGLCVAEAKRRVARRRQSRGRRHQLLVHEHLASHDLWPASLLSPPPVDVASLSLVENLLGQKWSLCDFHAAGMVAPVLRLPLLFCVDPVFFRPSTTASFLRQYVDVGCVLCSSFYLS